MRVASSEIIGDYRLRKIDDINFIRLRIILVVPFLVGAVTYWTGTFYFKHAPESAADVWNLYIGALLDFSLLPLFLIAYKDLAPDRYRFNKAAIFVWLLGVVHSTITTEGFALFLELAVAVMLLCLILFLDPATVIAVNGTLSILLFYSLFWELKSNNTFFLEILNFDYINLIILSLFFIVGVTIVSFFRYRELLNVLAEEEIIRRQKEKLEEAAEMREHIDRILRHDMKSPISGIISLAGIMKTEHIDLDSVRIYSDAIEKSGYSLLQLVENSLDLYRMEKGLYIPDRLACDLHEILSEIILPVRERSAIRNQRVTLIQDPGGKFIVHGDCRKIGQMINNLIQNALEASPEGKEISIGLTKRESVAAITIHNFGVVPEEIRGNLFSRYVTSGKKHGTGLGTYSALLIARAHGGDITFTTSEERGTTFTVTLPVSVAGGEK